MVEEADETKTQEFEQDFKEKILSQALSRIQYAASNEYCDARHIRLEEEKRAREARAGQKRAMESRRR